MTRAHDWCEDRTCSYGSAVDQQMMEVMSAWGPLIYAGCFAATLSSAIASLVGEGLRVGVGVGPGLGLTPPQVGAPRVLQALAKDKLYPYIEVTHHHSKPDKLSLPDLRHRLGR